MKIGSNADRLLLVPRVKSEAPAVAGALQAEWPQLRARRSAEGIAVPAQAAPDLLDGAPALELRWSEAAARFATNRSELATRHAAFSKTIEALKRANRPSLEARLPRIDDVGRLDDHQVMNVAVMVDPSCFGVCLFDEQGAGKTVSVIYAWDALSALDVVDFALVIAPKSMVAEWQADLERFRPGLYSVRTATGSRKSKLEALKGRPDVLITNFETAISLEHELTAQLRRLDGRALLVVDESFFVKSQDARRTRALKRIREWCGRAFVLCGTPAPNAASDIVEQFNLADLGATFGGVEMPDDREAAYAVVDAVLADRGRYLRSLKHDVLPDLPTKAFELVRVELQPAQRKAYEVALTDLILDLRATSDAEFAGRLTSFLARRLALLQICSNPARIINGYDETPAKLKALDRLLDELVGQQGEKVVVWSAYRASIDAIVARFSHLGVVRYDGAITNVGARRAAVAAFQEDAGTKLFVGNPAAAGAGLTLHTGRVSIYESLTNQAAHYLQSLDRIHRRGQERDVRYYVLLADDTIESSEFASLQRKERAAQDLLGDNVTQPPSRTGMLEELLAGTGDLSTEVAS